MEKRERRRERREEDSGPLLLLEVKRNNGPEVSNNRRARLPRTNEDVSRVCVVTVEERIMLRVKDPSNTLHGSIMMVPPLQLQPHDHSLPHAGRLISANRDSARAKEKATSRTADNCARETPMRPVADHSTWDPALS